MSVSRHVADPSAQTYLAAKDNPVADDRQLVLERAALAHVAVAVHAAGKVGAFKG